MRPITAVLLACALARPALVQTPIAQSQVAQSHASHEPAAPEIAPFTGILHDEVGGTLWAVGETYKASFSAAGASFVPYFAGAPRNFPITFCPRSARCGDTELPVLGAAPSRSGELVAFRHGGLRSAYELRARGVEQTFWFDALPARGDLVLEVTCETELAASPSGSGLRFSCEHGSVTYGAAVAVDAAGRRLAITTAWSPGLLRFFVPEEFVAAAELPLCIDPLVGNEQTVYSSPAGKPVGGSDIAYISTFSEYAVVYHRLWSTVDSDVYLARYDSAMNLRATQTIDATTSSWELPKVAGNWLAGNFLVVAQASAARSSPYWIAGRTVASYTGVTGPQMTIDYGGGDKMRPDVGGSLDTSAPTYFAVVYEHVVVKGDHDIRVRLVGQDGLSVMPWHVVLDGTTDKSFFPRISKNHGAGWRPTQGWGVTWLRRIAGVADLTCGAILRWDGTVAVPAFVVEGAFTTANPAVSSPTDDASGERRWLFAFEKWNTSPPQIFGTLVDQRGVVKSSSDLTSRLRPGWSHSFPAVDSDGCRFVVGYVENFLNDPLEIDTRLATFAPTPGDALVLQDSSAAGFTFDDETAIAVASTRNPNGGYGRYGVCWTATQKSGPSAIRARCYDGISAGGYSYRQTACGSGATIYTEAPPVLGSTLTLSSPGGGGTYGWVVGLPAALPIGQCPGCVLGVQGEYVGGPILRMRLPRDPSFTGAVLACQLVRLGGPCFDAVSFSNTVDVKLQ